MRRARQSIEHVFTPHPGPQTAAHECTAHVLGYGGSAGGGKTGLGIGKALTRHRRSIMLRRQFKDHAETEDFLDSLKGVNYNKNKHFAVTPDQRKLSLGHLQHERELKNWRGRGHDLIIIDEAAEWPEFFVRFLMGWNRTTIPDQYCQTLLTFNPPTTPQSPGRWVIDFFAAWLDPKHPKPAKDGELRWYAMLDGEEVEVESGEPFEHKNERGETELIEPLSRTFIRARLEDNPSLAETGYRARLQAMPEPLRSQLLYGDFAKGAEDHEW
ncbi:MAG TPA: terminase family protein, partial [Acidobacteriota bacterium]|nr:terminase family protein [Acidobacteriota bacterium]